MCCFSGSVKYVSNTRIFARLSGRGTQFLVYSMRYAADRELAMILPLPVPPSAGENAVRFISLKRYPAFFDDMEKGFPQIPQAGAMGIPGAGGFGGGRLAVQTVGDYVASFVPTLDDFGRLDSRFKLPRKTWDKIPAYRDFGFAVFQLRKRPDATPVHPMAMEFVTRPSLAHTLFLPTVHIHDGQVHPRETFDHTLYVQDARLRPTATHDIHGNPLPVLWERALRPSTGVMSRFVDTNRAQNLIAPGEIGFKRVLIGEFSNRDTLIRCG